MKLIPGIGLAKPPIAKIEEEAVDDFKVCIGSCDDEEACRHFGDWIDEAAGRSWLGKSVYCVARDMSIITVYCTPLDRSSDRLPLGA